MIRAGWIGFVFVAAVGSAWSQSFNIDVGPEGSTPPASYAAAGLAGVWNNVRADHVTPYTPGPTPQDVMLVDINGVPTSVGFHQYGGQDLVADDDPGTSGAHAKLLDDHLATHSATLESCMYLNGLEDGPYEVLIYAWMPNDPGVMQKTRFDFHPGFEIVGGTWTGAHEEGVTFSRHLVEAENGFLGFHVGIPPGGALFPGAAFNGFQVIQLEAAPVPALTPIVVALLGVGLALAGAWRLRAS